MKYKSRYFNLKSAPQEWTQQEFNFAIEILESLTRTVLFRLLDKFNIQFKIPEKDEKFLEDEEIISVLISDTNKNDLLEELKKIQQQPPLKFKTFLSQKPPRNS